MVSHFESLSWKLDSCFFEKPQGIRKCYGIIQDEICLLTVRNDSQDEDDPMGLGLLSYILQQFIYPLHQQIAILWDTHVFPFSLVLGRGYQKTVLFSTNDMNFLRFMCQVSCKFCLQMILIRRSATSGRQISTATSVTYASMKRPKYIPNTRASTVKNSTSHATKCHSPVLNPNTCCQCLRNHEMHRSQKHCHFFSHPLFEGVFTMCKT